MADQNHSTIAASLQAAQNTFTDITDMLLAADALIAQHHDADGDLLAAASNIIRHIRKTATVAGCAADSALISSC